MVNLEWYRTFKAVYQTGSLTAASKALFVSQPNVSQHLSALEAHIGKTLFERKPRLVPTDYGKLFYTQVVEAVEKLENVEAEFKAVCLKKQVPMIRLGAVKEYFHAVLVKKIKDIPAHLSLSFGLTQELIGRLSKAELDFVIATKVSDEKNLIFEPICQESFFVVGHHDLETSIFDEFVKQKDWERAEEWLLAQPWFAYSADLAIIRRFWHNNFFKRPAIKPFCVIPDMNTILEAIKEGEGLTVAADYILPDHLKREQLKLIWKGEVPTENTLYLSYDKTKVTSDQLALIKQFCTF